MDNGHLSPERLRRLHDVLAGFIERNDVPGLVALVARRDAVHVEVMGSLGEDREPMRRDAIFRIASMTRPVVAVAALILVEECRLRLDEPLDRWLPELTDRRVLRRIDGPLDDSVPAVRPITLRDLPTFSPSPWASDCCSRRQMPALSSQPRTRRGSASARPARRRCPPPTSGCIGLGR
jgi:hypothetical protein